MRSRRALPLAVLYATLAACGGGGGGDDEPADPSVWHLRSINVIRDSPNVQFFVDDTLVSSADYGSVTDYKPAHTGTRPLSLKVPNPSDLGSESPGTTEISPNDDFDFQGPTDYTLVAAGTVAEPHKFVITGTSREAVEDNKVNYQFINAAVDAGPLDVFITAAKGGIATPEKVATLAVGESSDATDLSVVKTNGASEDATRTVNFIIELRDPVSGTTLFESSALPISEQNRLLFVLADNVGPANVAPLKVFIAAGTAAGSAGLALDPDDGSELRFANISPDSGPLDLIVGDSVTDIFASNIAFGQASAYGPLPVAITNSIATPTGNAGSFLFVNNFTTTKDSSFTLYAQDKLASIRGLLFTDDRRSIPTQGRFRFLHASPAQATRAMDIYLRLEGAELDLEGDSPPAPSVSGLGYRALSSMLALKDGTYDVYFARKDAKTTILGPVPLILAKGDVKTLILADAPAGGLQLVPVDDARP